MSASPGTVDPRSRDQRDVTHRNGWIRQRVRARLLETETRTRESFAEAPARKAHDWIAARHCAETNAARDTRTSTRSGRLLRPTQHLPGRFRVHCHLKVPSVSPPQPGCGEETESGHIQSRWTDCVPPWAAGGAPNGSACWSQRCSRTSGNRPKVGERAETRHGF